MATQEAANAYAEGQTDLGGVWVDQSINPASKGDTTAHAELMNDPTKLVLNVSFTGDLDRHETDLRPIWGGSLCVSKAAHSAADLERIRTEAQTQVTYAQSDVDTVKGVIEIGVWVADPRCSSSSTTSTARAPSC